MAPTENTGGAAPAANSTTATTIKKKKSKRNKKNKVGNNFKGDATADSVLYPLIDCGPPGAHFHQI